MTQAGTLAIVAGGGPLPEIVAKAALARGREILVIALDGFCGPGIEKFPHRRVRIGQLAKALGIMREHGCRELVFIGTVRRPANWRRDVGLSLVWTMIRNIDLLWSGDARLLSRIVQVFEREGFSVVGVHEVAPELVLPAITLGRTRPTTRDERDIEIGFRAALGLGALDIGQGVVVARRRVVAAEAAEGTDAMLARVAGLRHGKQSGRVGVLVKCPQPIQDLRVDMPTIGPETMRCAAAAGLAGIAVAAGRVLAVDIEGMTALADEHGLFITAREVDHGGEP